MLPIPRLPQKLRFLGTFLDGRDFLTQSLSSLCVAVKLTPRRLRQSTQKLMDSSSMRIVALCDVTVSWLPPGPRISQNPKQAVREAKNQAGPNNKARPSSHDESYSVTSTVLCTCIVKRLLVQLLTITHGFLPARKIEIAFCSRLERGGTAASVHHVAEDGVKNHIETGRCS